MQTERFGKVVQHTNPAGLGLLQPISQESFPCFAVEQLIYDSTAFQFWGSEQYRQDIPLRDAKSFATTRDTSLFSDLQMQGYHDAAKRLNEERDGDQGCFIFRKL